MNRNRFWSRELNGKWNERDFFHKSISTMFLVCIVVQSEKKENSIFLSIFFFISPKNYIKKKNVQLISNQSENINLMKWMKIWMNFSFCLILFFVLFFFFFFFFKSCVWNEENREVILVFHLLLLLFCLNLNKLNRKSKCLLLFVCDSLSLEFFLIILDFCRIL